ncbi:hypothetical protein CLV91_1086 [Maribacter vaceletii]|uniref:Adhesin domain-containing protein n=1 Tax=Maribacter vaceletii TaxID=1206816 RepID=A0A495EDP2_9FLAO|nr:hypothetical protein [Maribacter vaceletii]RKR15004.1 hypothetical protein CLV91_1086 [Maribacter vaceletii]
MKKFIFPLLLFCSFIGLSQKVVKKSIVNSAISTIEIDATNCYKIEVVTTDNNEIILEALIDGEYQKDLLLNVSERESSIGIKTEFQPVFVSPNDKLSAHKVVSIALKIMLPKDKDVLLLGTNSNIVASGTYKSLRVSLEDGICNLSTITGDVFVTTKSGDIIVKNEQGKFITYSKYGEIKKDDFPEGETLFNLTTITGNILLNKVK